MKKLFTLLLIAGVGWYSLKNSEWGRNVRASIKGTFHDLHAGKEKSEPTRAKIRTAHDEIAKMDQEIDRMIRPMAEYTAAVNKLKRDLAVTETNLSEQKIVLRTLAKDLESGAASLTYGDATFSAERIEAKLQKDFKSFKRLEGQLKTQKTLLEAKQTSLRGVQEQMAKVMAKKQEFEVRLAQLEAEEEILQIAKLGSKLQIDQSITTQIEASLEAIALEQNVDRAELELRMGKVVEDEIIVTRPEPRMDSNSILRYLEGETTVKATP